MTDELDEARAQIAVLTEALRGVQQIMSSPHDGNEGYRTDFHHADDCGDCARVHKPIEDALADLPASAAAHIARDEARERDLANMDEYCHQKALVADAANVVAQSRLEVLQAVEWAQGRYNSCPWCNQAQNNGHASNCRLKAALDGDKQ